jgi:hypothetical protein
MPPEINNMPQRRIGNAIHDWGCAGAIRGLTPSPLSVEKLVII